MIYKPTKFEKAKRDSETKNDRGPFYSNPEEDKLWVPNKIVGYGFQPNIAHPKFRRALLYIVIGIIALNVLAVLIFR